MDGYLARGLLSNEVRFMDRPENHTHCATYMNNNLSGTLHSRVLHHKSQSLHDYNERYAKFSCRPQHFESSNIYMDTATDEMGQPKNVYTRAICAFNKQKKSVFVKTLVISAFIMCIIFLSV